MYTRKYRRVKLKAIYSRKYILFYLFLFAIWKPWEQSIISSLSFFLVSSNSPSAVSRWPFPKQAIIAVFGFLTNLCILSFAGSVFSLSPPPLVPLLPPPAPFSSLLLEAPSSATPPILPRKSLISVIRGTQTGNYKQTVRPKWTLKAENGNSRWIPLFKSPTSAYILFRNSFPSVFCPSVMTPVHSRISFSGVAIVIVNSLQSLKISRRISHL